MHFELLCVFMLPHKFNKVNNKTRALCAVAITQNQFIQIETKRLRIVLIWHTPYSPTLTKINVGWFNIQHSGQKSYFWCHFQNCLHSNFRKVASTLDNYFWSKDENWGKKSESWTKLEMSLNMGFLPTVLCVHYADLWIIQQALLMMAQTWLVTYLIKSCNYISVHVLKIIKSEKLARWCLIQNHTGLYRNLPEFYDQVFLRRRNILSNIIQTLLILESYLQFWCENSNY